MAHNQYLHAVSHYTPSLTSDYSPGRYQPQTLRVSITQHPHLSALRYIREMGYERLCCEVEVGFLERSLSSLLALQGRAKTTQSLFLSNFAVASAKVQ